MRVPTDRRAYILRRRVEGASQQLIADELGITRQAVAHHERKAQFSVTQFESIAQAIGVSPEELGSIVVPGDLPWWMEAMAGLLTHGQPYLVACLRLLTSAERTPSPGAI